MKLYNSMGPNPRVVKMFMAERNIDIPLEEVDLMGGANRQTDYLKKNPAGQLPCLELDDGTYLAEVTAICEYLDDKEGASSLIGKTPEERAQTHMWTRRADLNVCEPLANGFRFSEGLPLFKDRMRCLPDAADGLKQIAQDKISWLDEQMAGKDYLAGDRMSLADILLFCFIDFGITVGQPLNQDNKNVLAWYERMKNRESAAATA